MKFLKKASLNTVSVISGAAGFVTLPVTLTAVTITASLLLVSLKAKQKAMSYNDDVSAEENAAINSLFDNINNIVKANFQKA